jgi:hypothetical protein
MSKRITIQLDAETETINVLDFDGRLISDEQHKIDVLGVVLGMLVCYPGVLERCDEVMARMLHDLT